MDVREGGHRELIRLSPGCALHGGRLDTRYSPVRRSPSDTASRIHAAPRLACVRPVASVHPEPGSNSPLYKEYLLRGIRQDAAAVFSSPECRTSLFTRIGRGWLTSSQLSGRGSRSRCLQHGTHPSEWERPAVPPLCLHVTLSKNRLHGGGNACGRNCPKADAKVGKNHEPRKLYTTFLH